MGKLPWWNPPQCREDGQYGSKVDVQDLVFMFKFCVQIESTKLAFLT